MRRSDERRRAMEADQAECAKAVDTDGGARNILVLKRGRM